MCSSSGGQNCITQPLVSSHLYVEAWNKLTVKQKFCASSWLNTLRCTVSETSKFEKSLFEFRHEWLISLSLSLSKGRYRFWGHPVSYSMGITRFFPGIKRQGLDDDDDDPAPYSADVKDVRNYTSKSSCLHRVKWGIWTFTFSSYNNNKFPVP